MAYESFDHVSIEKNAQKRWADEALYETDLSKDDPYYLLVEFPYPSGDLHIGHWYAFALTDIYARYLRMQGKNVLFPIGFDAFGLPAENAAIRNNVDPKQWTYDNMDRMRRQIKTMGTTFDWSKEVVTCDPAYYKWTQWLFTKLYEHNLAYRGEAPVKWCPKDATVLANEQVVDGTCERCGTPVEEKRLTQWFMKITEYAKRLLADLEPLPWREEIKEAQRAWIGESEGAKMSFQISIDDAQDGEQTRGSVEVFTTRPDTIFGATYVVLAPEHPLVATLPARNKNDVSSYVAQTKKKTERERSENKEKTGVKLEGVCAVNPATKEKIPLYVADYVLGSYGTGAVMAVPAHDERDHEFAVSHNLPETVVIESPKGASCYTGDGTLINSGSFSGKQNREAYADIISFCGGEKTTNYRIRDWLISRQRYWGCPIPIVYDPEGKPQAIPLEHLPWLLPTDVDFTPTGQSPLASSKELRERVTRLFGEGWTPEFDTLDTFVDSSWYYTRYLASTDETKFSEPSLMKKWLPVDRYSGGSEHTTMHLLYARFFHKALFDLSLVPTPEPFGERFNRGLILGPDGHKMSKSKGNVVNPDEFVGKYGADAVRMYLAFIGPYNEAGSYPWNLDGVASMRRFLDRIYTLAACVQDVSVPAQLTIECAKAIQKVSTDTERFKFNTAISALMVLVRALEDAPVLPKSLYLDLIRLLAPYAPHLSEYLFEKLGNTQSIHTESWPQAATLSKVAKEIIVQVSGKRKGTITLPEGATEEMALKAAIQLPPVRTALKNTRPERVVYVPGRILNLVPKG